MCKMASGGSSGSAVNLVLKYFLFFLNFFICIVCAGVMSLMAWLIAEKGQVIDIFLKFILCPTCIICLVAAVATVVSFFGWFGALREVIVCLKIYRWIISFFLLIVVGGVIFIFVLVYVPDVKKQTNIYPEDALKAAIPQYREDEDTQNLIDGFQQLIGCCGMSSSEEGYKDWNANIYFNCSSQNKGGEACSVPYSCCKAPTQNSILNYACGKDMLNRTKDDAVLQKTIYARGCFKGLTDIMEQNVIVFGGIMLGIILPQILLIGFSQRLETQIRIQLIRQKKSVDYQRAPALPHR
ncbi:hypothetical protein CHS0354_037791 [Potamilus streckersoni]|uniref:Tetraspanin n=1 Tax=Potamilus streckersoni TaxID=2493646 RepID=A0AAE0W5Q0_9BIVA|nr:hypothetical protein CHS0354_037791 [Potamilus streckersoni]